MSLKEALEIFKRIDSDKYTDNEKEVAIDIVLKSALSNFVRREDMRNVIRWLWYRCFELKGAKNEHST